MIIQNTHMLADLRELWSVKSFRARIFLAMLPTAIALIVGYYVTDAQRPYDFHKEGSFIEPPVGTGGDQVTVNWKVTFYRQCTGHLTRTLVDPNSGVLLAVYDTSPVASASGVFAANGYLRKTFTIPRSMPPGVIGYKAQLEYQCNWLQRMFPRPLSIRYETPMLLFKVER